jgi:hypothetical protein
VDRPATATSPPPDDPPTAVTTRLPVRSRPAPAAPRRRRRALLAVGLAVVVAVAVPVAVVLAGGEEPRVVPTATPDATVVANASKTPTASPTATATETATATAEPTPTPTPRSVRRTVASPKRDDDLPLALDAETDVPSQVGRWSPSEDASLGAAEDAFGSDFVITPDPGSPYLCTVEWPDVGMTVYFADLGGGDPCGDSGQAATIEIDGLVSDRWRTLSGLRPGMRESTIEKLYDDARKTSGDWWLVTATTQIGDAGEYGPIIALIDDGVVSGFHLTVGAGGD